MTPTRRTTFAAAALAVAVLIPTTAWYITGSSAAGRTARELESAALTGLKSDLYRDAERLADRLDRLRSDESQRPFFHYQNLTHDPLGAAEGLAVMQSPLAQGVSDPLVWAHFQLDETGLVTVPMLNEQFPELTSPEAFARFCSLLAELQNTMAVSLDEPGASGESYFEGTFATIPRSEWEQIQDADKVYAAIKGRGEKPARKARGEPSEVIIRTGPLKWHTMVFGTGPSLTALREVETPVGIRLQGFVVAQSGVEQWLGVDRETRVAFVPLALLPTDHLSTPVATTGWWLGADAGPLVAAARAEGREAIAEFRRAFSIGLAAILLSALAVMSVVIQTERLARQRGRFAAAAAHELKTPLASLRLHSEMLAEGLGRPEQTATYAERVAAESGRLGRVVSNMLDLARLERGAKIANPRAGDLGSAVERCLERLRPSLSDSGLEISADIADGLPTVRFDEDALCQILDNLLDNAEKYSREQDERRAEVIVRASDDGATITVSDNGPGIPAAARRSLFDPFERPKDDDAPAGLGLGLALARSLARAQGGDLVLADGVGTGAAFVLTLARVPS